jgi:hypothetical protein
MDISSIAGLASSTAAMNIGDTVGLAVLNKAMDIQVANAAALIEALPQVEPPNLPAHLGHNVDTIA